MHSPGSARASSARSERASADSSPAKSTTSSHSRPQSAHSRYLDEDSARHSEDASVRAPEAASARRALKIDDSSTRATPQMGSEATIRYLKARLVVMEEELSEAGAVAREREERLTELEQRNKELEEDKAKSTKNADALKVKLEKTKKELQDKTKLAESLDHQLRASVKEKEHLERTYKQTDSAAGAKDVRLNRALEEVERYKRLLNETKASHSDMSEQARKQVDAALAEKKKLVKQKNELITGFRNQMKLVDVLKRQIIHLQAAKMLDLSEKDFTRALELGEQI